MKSAVKTYTVHGPHGSKDIIGRHADVSPAGNLHIKNDQYQAVACFAVGHWSYATVKITQQSTATKPRARKVK